MRSEYGIEKVGVEGEFAEETGGVRKRCGDLTPVTNIGQLRVEGMDRVGLKVSNSK